MTRKHFEAFAAEIRLIPDAEARQHAIRAAIRAFRQFNGKFDESRFARACQPEEAQ